MRLLLMGSDVLAAARPATPVQMTHACLRLGFDAVIPGSWGDELVAAACVEDLSRRGNGTDGPRPVVLAACPHVTDRVLANGAELSELLVTIAPPPVALARYLRAISTDQPLHLTWAGDCPAAEDHVLDARMSADQLFSSLESTGIDPSRLPLEFEDVLPPDRRRYLSRPGGIPTPEAIAGAGADWKVVEIAERELPLALAQLLLSDDALLVDLAPRVGCRCTGARGECSSDVRDAVTTMEPPRSPAAVVDHSVVYDPKYPLPPVVSPPAGAGPGTGQAERPPEAPSGPPDAPPAAPPTERYRGRTRAPVADTSPPQRSSPVPRTIVAGTPTSRTAEGRTLPRAYVSRRRSTPPPDKVRALDGGAAARGGKDAPPAAAPPPPREPGSRGSEPLLYGGHSGPLGRLTRPDQTERDRAIEGRSPPGPAAHGDDHRRLRVALLVAGVGAAGALVGSLLGWLLRG